MLTSRWHNFQTWGFVFHSVTTLNHRLVNCCLIFIARAFAVFLISNLFLPSVSRCGQWKIQYTPDPLGRSRTFTLIQNFLSACAKRTHTLVYFATRKWRMQLLCSVNYRSLIISSIIGSKSLFCLLETVPSRDQTRSFL